MAHYLPVLLVSVTSTIAPDDTAVSTQPRGQVDYLSHQWREEDVWKSWRNMTRKKNEIANGQRLENASWRTWWKQRNKLGTVTPETLNWLKDSDVTWLYGPLHTAVDSVPPPRRYNTELTTADKPAQDRLDLSVPNKPLPPANHTKSILKHRSISELLTADLASPIFSPADSSEDEMEGDTYGLSDINEEEVLDVQGLSPQLQRPPLPHTRSDSFVIKADKPFRKESPPRVAPPGTSSGEPIPDRVDPANRGRGLTPSSSRTNLQSYFSSGAKSPALSTSSLGHSYSKRDESRPVSASSKSAKKRISFNTFVEQCIAIDKPRHLRGYGRYHDGEWYDDDDEEVRMRTGAGHVWHRTRAAESDSDSSFERPYFREAEDGSEDEEDNIEMKPPSPSTHSLPFAEQEHPHQLDEPPHQLPSTMVSESPPKTLAVSSSPTVDPPSPTPTYVQTPTVVSSRRRSKSKASTSSSSTVSTSSSSNAFSTSSRYKPRTRSGTVIRAPGSMLKTSSLGGERETLTIAPIAPTVLKTGEPPCWSDEEESCFGLDVNGWVEGVTPAINGWSSPHQHGTHGNGRLSKKDRNSSEKAVELVYVPPTWRNRAYIEDESDEVEDSEEDDGIYHRPTRIPAVDVRVTPPSPRKHNRGRRSTTSPDRPSPLEHPSELETRGRSRTTDDDEVGGDERHLSFGAELRRYPTNGAYDRHRRGSNGILDHSPSSSPPKSHLFATQSAPGVTGPDSHRSSSPTSNSLLTPPTRGRTMSSGSTDSRSSSPQSRGRSSTRTSSSFSDRERSRHGSSSLGSLSPDGVGSGAPAPASGRHSRSRHRGSSSRSLSQSLSPDDHVSSSSSPRKACVEPQLEVAVPSPIAEVDTEEEKYCSRNPSPSNSPAQRISIPTQPLKDNRPAVNANNQQPQHQRKLSLSDAPNPGVPIGPGSDSSSLVGRMVSSAGSYLGFWNSSSV